MCNLSVVFRKIKSFIKVSNEIKFNFIKAYIYTGIARAYILFLPFNKLRKRMGKSKIESPGEVSEDTYNMARNIGCAVRLASRYTLWESKCLVQALAVQWMLKKEGVSTTLYLGVGKSANNEMLAHAWIRCGSYIITGGVNKDSFAIVAKFTNLT